MIKDLTSTLKGITVNIQTQADIDYWCRLLNCSEKDLFAAVSRIGHSAIAVEAYMNMNGTGCYPKKENERSR